MKLSFPFRKTAFRITVVLLTLTAILFSWSAVIAAIVLDFNVPFSSAGYDVGYNLIEVSDGYVLTGTYNGDACWIKTNFNGGQTGINTNLNSAFGMRDYAFSVIQVPDGYVIVGEAEVADPNWDVMWIHLDFNGILLDPIKTYPLSGGRDTGFDVVEAVDGYIIIGTLDQFGVGDVFWMKVDFDGNQVGVPKTYSGTSLDAGRTVVQKAGGYVICGDTSVPGQGTDILLIETDANGNQVGGFHTYGGVTSDTGFDLCQTSDGGYAVAGYYYTGVSGNYGALLLKTDASFNQEGAIATFGDGGFDTALSLAQAADGGYILAGQNSDDVWLIKTDSNRVIEPGWPIVFGGGSTDYGEAVIQDANGAFVATGTITSGSNNIFLAKYHDDTPPPPPPPSAVGGNVYSADKMEMLLPWLLPVALIAFSIAGHYLNRRKKNGKNNT